MGFRRRPAASGVLAPLEAQIRGFVGGKQVIYIGAPHDALVQDLERLQSAKAAVSVVISFEGNLQDVALLDQVPRRIETVRISRDELDDPTDWRDRFSNNPAVNRLFDAIDPARTSLILCAPTARFPQDTNGMPTVAGRRVLNVRLPKHEPLEDKTSGLLKTLGLPMPRHVVAGANPKSVINAFKGLQSRSGVVISLDTKMGITAAGYAKAALLLNLSATYRGSSWNKPVYPKLLRVGTWWPP